ncbi:MAG: lyase family protein, partial [Pseudomonadota bacterium]
RVEAALAGAQTALGVIPEGVAPAIRDAEISSEGIAEGVAKAGVPVPAFLANLRASMPPERAQWVHYGATSQDIVDTALSLSYGAALADLETALATVIDTLAAKAQAHQGVAMLGRTRGQLATPISFALRVANWAAPLIALETELPALRRRALKVQLGGAAGSGSVFAPYGAKLREEMARALGLEPAPPWHSDRTGIAALAAWLSQLISSLAKMAGDLGLTARGEIAEMRAGAGGGSSTMPHKSNPVLTEALRSAHPLAVGLMASLQAASLHAEERDGAAWAVEWAVMPQLFELAAASLDKAATLASDVTPVSKAMAARIEATPGALAEAAVFALAPAHGRPAALTRVEQAMAQGGDLAAALAAEEPGLEMQSAADLAALADAAARDVFATRR